MRPLRCTNPGNLFEITTRVHKGQMLLRPSKEVNSAIIGVIGRAQTHYDVKIHAFVFMSTHYHILLSVPDTDTRSAFVGFINCNITKKLNAINERTGATWQRRFTCIPVAKDRTTQVRRLRYLLSHGIKERLVERAKQWPGATSLPWLVEGRPIKGVWTSFTKRYYARKRANFEDTPGRFDTKYVLSMSVLPCWGGMPEAAWRTLVVGLIEAIEADEAAERKALNLSTLGAAAVLAADPFSFAGPLHARRAPTVHACDSVARLFLEARLRAIREAYSWASAMFRAGQWDVAFPVGTLRPQGGLVRGNHGA